MQIVIDIPKEDYKGLQEKDKFDDMCLGYYEKLIVHGTPLPDTFDIEVSKSDMKALYPYGLDYLLGYLKKRLGVTIT